MSINSTRKQFSSFQLIANILSLISAKDVLIKLVNMGKLDNKSFNSNRWPNG